ncbi:hypothetical protein BZA05DRAFT_446517 [Tricharina praecox]|uniref:uncharacterized protein n=1 Tax=Tricharina praecox TaxID=43433 RepID=UPI002220753C|nr:uncharacterized protein BZA05DRAFT_446517 [Tricharina praecox]KAI5848220.1 hypothetical protein BZA05DRAFT_446517 [Tricharina praecox]
MPTPASAAPAPPPPPLTAFISGPITPPAHFFETHYLPFLQLAVSQSHNFIMGPAAGIDTLCLSHLLSAPISACRITVYLADFENHTLRSSYAAFEAAGGKIKVEGATTGARDAAMTRDSDYDILRYLNEHEAREYYGEAYTPRISNTQKNERRRRGEPLHYNPAFETEVVIGSGDDEDGVSPIRRRFVPIFGEPDA